MLSVTIPNISPSQNTPVLPNIRRIVTRPRGANCSRRNSAKLSLATIFYPVLARQSQRPEDSSDDDPINRNDRIHRFNSDLQATREIVRAPRASETWRSPRARLWRGLGCLIALYNDFARLLRIKPRGKRTRTDHVSCRRSGEDAVGAAALATSAFLNLSDARLAPRSGQSLSLAALA